MAGRIIAMRIDRRPHAGSAARRAYLLAASLLALASWNVAAAQRPDVIPLNSAGLSPYWDADIQSAATTVTALARTYGFHPDFVAAVIAEESGEASPPGRFVGALGLMELTATGASEPPLAEVSLSPNLHWGMAILSHVVQQSGGDLQTALAAYVGGWEHVNSRTAREYAARVLDAYGRALLMRAGLSPEMAGRWTVAVEIRAGNVPEESLLLLGSKPVTGLHPLAAHTVYAFTNPSGQPYYVRGYVVPIGLSAAAASTAGENAADQLEAPLRARLGEKDAPTNPYVLLVCLPSMSRLRGQVRTRWYAPSNCPAAER